MRRAVAGWLSWVAALLLAAIFAWAGIRKLAADRAVAGAMGTILERLLPRTLVPSSAGLETWLFILGCVEIGLAVLLLIPRSRPLGAVCAGVFLLGITVLYGVATNWGALVDVGCPCGLPRFVVRIGSHFTALIVRNVLLLAAVAAVCIANVNAPPRVRSDA